MTNSEIIKEMKETFKEIHELIQEQKFCVGDANMFLEKYSSILNRLEELERSRDNWKKKHNKLKKELEDLKDEKN